MKRLKVLPAFPGVVADVTGIEAEVCLDIIARQAFGKKKYPTELALNPAKLRARLQHAYEETLDHAAYLKWAITKLDEEGRALRRSHRALEDSDIIPEELRD